MNAPITTIQPNLHDRRVAAGLSLRRLSELAEVSMSMTHLLDNGYRPRHSDARDRIEAVLNGFEREAAA